MPHVSRRRFLAGTGLAAGALATSPLVAAPEAPDPPKFQLGLVTYNLAAKWDVPTIVKVCNATGLTAVEFRTTHAHGVEPTMGKNARKELHKTFADTGIKIWGCGSVCEFHSPMQEVVRQNIETCKRFVELVADVGGRGVKVRPNGLPRDVPEAKTLEQIGKALVPCGKAAADAGVEIHVEVHGGGTADPPRMKAILEHCGHPAVGITWNSNPTDLKNGSVAEAFKMLSPWLLSCHINTLYSDAAGKYPYRELFRLLRQKGYDRVTLIELGKGMPDVESATEFLRYYKALWTELCRG